MILKTHRQRVTILRKKGKDLELAITRLVPGKLEQGLALEDLKAALEWATIGLMKVK